MHFIFDENLSHRLAEGLSLLESGDLSSPITKISHMNQLLEDGASDQEVIQEAGKTNAIIISQDDDFKRIRSHKALIKSLGVGYVMYRPPKRGSSYWDIVQAFIQGWPEIKNTLKEKKTPFLFQIDKNGKLAEIDL